MKSKLGYIGQKKPKDYTLEKYIALPVEIRFKHYLKKIGCLPPVLLEMERDITDLDNVDLERWGYNIFDRKKFFNYMINSQKPIKDLYIKAIEELEYMESIGWD